MKILETAALTDEVYFAFIDLAAKYSDRFSFEMNEPISEKAVQTKRNIIMETIADGSVGMEMKERIVAQQLDALVCAPVETLQYYTCCIPYMRLMERHELKGAEPGGRPAGFTTSTGIRSRCSRCRCRSVHGPARHIR